MRALVEGPSSAAFDEAERTALLYAEAMTRTPVDVPDALFGEVRSRWNDAEIIELTACIAWENFRARFDHALSIESQGYSEGAFCPLPPQRTP